MVVSLETAKSHLNITSDADDALISRLISAAGDWLERQLGYKVADRYPDGVPAALDQAMLMVAGHWYANREATLVGVTAQEVPLGVTDLINGYRDWSWGYADG